MREGEEGGTQDQKGGVYRRGQGDTYDREEVVDLLRLLGE